MIYMLYVNAMKAKDYYDTIPAPVIPVDCYDTTKGGIVLKRFYDIKKDP